MSKIVDENSTVLEVVFHGRTAFRLQCGILTHSSLNEGIQIVSAVRLAEMKVRQITSILATQELCFKPCSRSECTITVLQNDNRVRMVKLSAGEFTDFQISLKKLLYSFFLC